MVVRRSSRAKKQAASIYDDAKKDLELVSPRSRARALKQANDSDDDDDDDDMDKELQEEPEEEEDKVDESSDEDDMKDEDPSSSSDDEDFGVPTSSSKKKKTTPSPRNRATRTPLSQVKAPPKTRNIRLQYKSPTSAKKNKTKRTTQPRKGLANAMTALARKVLEPEEETPETSLVAALLDIGRPQPQDPYAPPKSRVVVHRLPQVVLDRQQDDPAFAGLEQLARTMVSDYHDNPSATQVRLINLIVRSVGGRHANLLDPAIADLDDFDDDEWGTLLEKIVKDIQHTPPDQILYCAHPQGAVAAAKEQQVANHHHHHHNHNNTPMTTSTLTPTTTSPAILAVQTYRQLFSEFWYLLGCVGLAGTTQVGGGDLANRNNKKTPNKKRRKDDSSNDSSDSDDSDHDDDDDEGAPSSSRFAIEMVRDIAIRLMELVGVNMPDVRMAATSAAFELFHAALDWTLEWNARLKTAHRQYNAAAKVSKTSSKTLALKYQVETLTRTIVEVEELVQSMGFKGIFMNRYKDTNPHIRAMVLRDCSKWTLQRPDLFLKDTCLKYFGWMASDKHPVVRVAALQGLLAPLERAKEQQGKRHGASNNMVMTIDPDAMTKVIGKFLNRIADCTLDVDKGVQQVAMALLLRALRDGFLDELDNDGLWDQVNLRAVATNTETTALVRRDALHFVLEQLEAFDEDASDKAPESRIVEQIDSIATWVAHALSDGCIPIDKMRVDRVAFIMQSLREMPEHAHLATNWTAMLTAIKHATTGASAKSSRTEQAASNLARSDVAKQRVLLQMLTYAAELEVCGEDENDEESALTEFLDPDFVAAKRHGHYRNLVQSPFAKKGGKKKQSSDGGMSREHLTLGLLKALPELLEAFGADLVILRSLTTLPRYFVPSVLSLPPRKADVLKLLKVLSRFFQESTDTTVLNHICLALTFLARADHARSREAQLELKTVAGSIRDRLDQLYSDETATQTSVSSPGSTSTSSPSRRSRRSANSVKHGETDAVDKEHSIFLCLKRLRILSKRWYLGDLLEREGADRANEDVACASLCSTIANNMAKQLKLRTPEIPEDDSSNPSVGIPEIWTTADPRIHRFVGMGVTEGLNIILSVAAWKLHRAMEMEKAVAAKKNKADKDDVEDSDEDEDAMNDDDDVEETNVTENEVTSFTQSVVRMRDGLYKLLTLCFDQFLEEPEREGIYSREHLHFASYIQLQAGRCSADLRSLFPREWTNAESPLLRACAFTDDLNLIGGYVRFFRSQEDEVSAITQGRHFVDTFLLHLSRCIASNWTSGNRREAGSALSHAAGSGEETTKMVLSLLKVLRRIEPVRALEAHMACLRQCYADWVDSEPDEPEGDHPSNEELVAFEALETEHVEDFKLMELKAAKLSATLGVGKLNDKKKVEPALVGFFNEGIRFAFSNDEADSDEELLLGSHLSFLSIISKYLMWAKKQKTTFKALQALFTEKEMELREHADFHEIREEDLEALAAFRKAMGLKEVKQPTKNRRSSGRQAKYAEDSDDEEDLMSVDSKEEDDHHSVGSAGSHSSGGSRGSSAGRHRKRRISRASVGSNRSGMSTQLSPLAEESEESPSPQKRRKLDGAIQEESEESKASSDEVSG